MIPIRPVRGLVLLGLLLPAAASFAAPTLTVSPASIDAREVGTVRVEIGNLAGAKAILRLYVDADGDGLLGPGEYVVWTDVIKDDVAEWSPNMFSDTDPAPGAITVNVRLFTPISFPYTSGAYLWKVEDAFDGSMAEAPFAVTRSPEPQSVSGTVIDGVTSQPVPGALVVLVPVSDLCQTGGELSTFADGAGGFSLPVPASLECNHRFLLAARPGYVTNQIGQPHLIFTGTEHFTGQTVRIAPGQHEVAGRLVYETGPDAGEGIPGVPVFAQAENGPPFLAVAFTGEDGHYAFALTDGSWFIEADRDDAPALQGVARREGDGVSVVVSGGPAAAPVIRRQAANAFIAGTVRDAAGLPLGGQSVRGGRIEPCDRDCFVADIQSGADGTFVLGVVAPPSPGANTYSSVPSRGFSR